MPENTGKYCRKCKKLLPEVAAFCMYCGTPTTKERQKRTRRGNGEGTVYRRDDVKGTPWTAKTARVTKGGKTTGGAVIGHYATQKEAREALEAYRRNPTERINISFQEIYEEWSAVAYRNISRQTIDNYRSAWMKVPTEMREQRFREVRTPDLQEIIDSHAAMSFSTLSKIKALLTQLYDYAMQNDIVNKNYASYIALPKQTKKKKDCFTDEEVSMIKAAVGVVPHADAILAMCYTGFRISEFLALSSSSYDAEAQTLTGGMKTEAGRDRVVPVHPKIQSFVERCVTNGGEALVCKEDGSPYNAKYFREKVYYPALEAIGVRKLSPHATRHTFLTMLSAKGARPEDMQALAGHEDYEVTANTYIHQNVDTLKRAVMLLD